MARILVSGALANKPRSGGEAWVRMSWVRGLRRLGHEVCFVEQIGSAEPVNVETFRTAVAALAPDCPVALICGDRSEVGLALEEAVEWARGADLLVNISGHLEIEAILEGPRRRAYIDVDPGFTQIWAEEGAAARLEGHDTFFTVGENIGAPECAIPTAGREWLPLPPPATLEDWPVVPVPRDASFTTVATWRSPLGTLEYDGRTFEGKHHQWRRLIHLPRRVDQEFEIALQIDPDDEPDEIALEANGWRLTDPTEVAGDPLAFRVFVQGSAAELSVAHPVYVDTASGWVSDRTVRYLASGRPALVQDTGIGGRYPVGEGLLTFRTPDEAVAGAEAIADDYATHARAARALAETHFDSDRLLGRFLEAAL
ncbi:MAG TPA: hypothetical protein VG448_08275 [Solirubrobacterales bacterium]|nr:hypothetical protein [Solirubrobacterales bacterium]